MFKFMLNKNLLLLAYKLLTDLLFLVLIFFTFTLVIESLLPGIITSHISFLKIIFLLALNLLTLYFLGHYLKINFPTNQTNKKTVLFLTVLFSLLIFNSLLKLNIFLAIIILFLALLISYFLYQEFLEVNS